MDDDQGGEGGVGSAVDLVTEVAVSASMMVGVEGFHVQDTAGIVRISNSQDLASVIHQNVNASSLSSFIISNTRGLLQLLPSFPALIDSPIVLHATYKDLADVMALRSAIPYIIHSSGIQQCFDNAIISTRLASLGRLVLHVFPANLPAEKVGRLGFARVKEHMGWDRRENSSAQSPIDNTSRSPSYAEYAEVARDISGLLGRLVQPAIFSGPSGATTLLVTLGEASLIRRSLASHESVALLDISLIRPIPAELLNNHIAASTTKVVVLEQVYGRATKWLPLFLEISGFLAEKPISVFSVVLGQATAEQSIVALSELLHALQLQSPPSYLTFGRIPDIDDRTLAQPHVPVHESSYTKLLSHLFGSRLYITNDPTLTADLGENATRPEYALGRIFALDAERSELENDIRELLEADIHGYTNRSELHTSLNRWLAHKDDERISQGAGDNIVRILEKNMPEHPTALRVLSRRKHLPLMSRWIIGSDSWSYDLGSSGLHHLIASSRNVNILLLDNTPYTARDSKDPRKRKKDVGLYAMNHGDAFVASIAVYSSYSQSLLAILEADRHRGASVVLAYLPYRSEDDSALNVLKETKLAVDAGYWPLYRWDPTKRDGEQFQLESESLKADLQVFLDRQSHLSQLGRTQPDMAQQLISSLGTHVQDARREKAKQSYETLLKAMEGPPLLVLYASDGGTAEKLSKRLTGRARARGLAAQACPMDSVSVEQLQREQQVVFVTSTAGQGEAPQNGRDTFRALSHLVAQGEKAFEDTPLKFSVFGLGDSHYWPRPEDAGYYNKPAKDLNSRLEALGAERVAPLGLGDDQDPDGPQTGYKVWEPLLWKALGVDSIEVLEAEPEPVTNENIKIASNYLRGTIAEGLKDTSTGALAASDGQLTKFHGIYQQDDRDIRDERQDAGLEPAYAFMIRVRMPGGVCEPEQWLAMDRIADERGNGTFKLTTRQTFQFHGVIKKHLKPSIQAINKALLDTIAACGDVNRNVICSSLPDLSHLHTEVYDFSKHLSEHLLPRMVAYHEIWLDKKMVAGDAVKEMEPLYGPYYLPRKFKIAVAIPPTNDVDVFTNDVGFIAVADGAGTLVGFNVTAGGGMGVTHSNRKTYPRTGDLLGFCTPSQGHQVAEAIMMVQKENGNRADRKNARLKYTIDSMGLDRFKAEVEQRLGWVLLPVRPFTFTSNIDKFGWNTGYNGKHHFTMFIENGRVQDEPGKYFKTGLREIAQVHKGKFRLTANQHLVLADVQDEHMGLIKRLLTKYNLDNVNFSGLRLSSSACVAFPTCGLAMAESERYLPILIDKVEAICEENGLRSDSIVMRMTGCPNGCARPYVAEVAFVGKAPGSYVMLLGGGYHGQRLNKIYRENVTEPEILSILRPMIKRYALERSAGENFGDFVIRTGYISPTRSGKEWYEGMGGEGQYKALSRV